MRCPGMHFSGGEVGVEYNHPAASPVGEKSMVAHTFQAIGELVDWIGGRFYPRTTGRVGDGESDTVVPVPECIGRVGEIVFPAVPEDEDQARAKDFLYHEVEEVINWIDQNEKYYK